MCGVGGGGDFIWEELCLCCRIHREDYVHVVKFIGGSMSTLQNSRGWGLCPPIKNEQEDFVRGGILSVSDILIFLFALKQIGQIHVLFKGCWLVFSF